MALHRIEARQLLPIGREQAWAFFSDPRNLARITPPKLRFEVRSETPEEIYAGLIVTYWLRPLLGIAIDWVTEITHVERAVMFVDEQRLGPYRFWHHQHQFREAPGGVEMRDVVHYALPLGPLGAALNALVVGARVRAIFAHRRAVLATQFGGSASRTASA